MPYKNILVENSIFIWYILCLKILEITITVEGVTTTCLHDGKKRGLSQFESN